MRSACQFFSLFPPVAARYNGGGPVDSGEGGEPMEPKPKCLALRVLGQPDAAEAERLIRSAMGGERGWGVLEIEMFPGREGTLLLAHPARGVYISRDALCFLLCGRE